MSAPSEEEESERGFHLRSLAPVPGAVFLLLGDRLGREFEIPIVLAEKFRSRGESGSFESVQRVARIFAGKRHAVITFV